jgi:hypothetical protein
MQESMDVGTLNFIKLTLLGTKKQIGTDKIIEGDNTYHNYQ